MIDIDTETHGPIFTPGLPEALMHAATRDIEETIAEKAKDKIHTRLGHVLKHPTGYYQSRIHVERQGSGEAVNDGGVVYGPWLEGVGSRNRTTRFKGYHTFRIVGQQIEAEATPLADHIMAQHLRRLT